MKYYINKLTFTNLIVSLLLVTVVSSLFSCGGNTQKAEISLRNKDSQCLGQSKRNTFTIERLLFDIKYHNNNSKRYSAVTKKCLLLDSMRVKYSSRFIRKDLLSYADTVMKHYDKEKDKDAGVVSDWNFLRKDILNADSSAILDLYYLTLVAESDLLLFYSIEMSPWCGWDPLLQAFGREGRYALNDTVNMILRSEFVSLSDEIEFDFKGIICKNASNICC